MLCYVSKERFEQGDVGCLIVIIDGAEGDGEMDEQR